MKNVIKPLYLVVLFGLLTAFLTEKNKLSGHLLFYASFDEGARADFAVGDREIYTAENRKDMARAKKGLLNTDVAIAKGRGLVGDALDFKRKSGKISFYRAAKNMGYSGKDWSGAVSFWLQLDPARDLEPGYCDPIQITDVNYNDAALWVDFTKDNPRDFRLGAMGDLKVWNPDNSEDEQLVEARLVRVGSPPFERGKWTHVLMNFSGLNTQNGKVELYVDGSLKGSVDPIKDPFTWEEEKAGILLGLNYIGLMDELAVFDRKLTRDEVKTLSTLNKGLKTILE